MADERKLLIHFPIGCRQASDVSLQIQSQGSEANNRKCYETASFMRPEGFNHAHKCLFGFKLALATITNTCSRLSRDFSLSLTSGGRYGVLLLGLKLREKRVFDFLFFAPAFFGATPCPFLGLALDATPWEAEPCPFPEPNNSDTRVSISRSTPNLLAYHYQDGCGADLVKSSLTGQHTGFLLSGTILLVVSYGS